MIHHSHSSTNIHQIFSGSSKFWQALSFFPTGTQVYMSLLLKKALSFAKQQTVGSNTYIRGLRQPLNDSACELHIGTS